MTKKGEVETDTYGDRDLFRKILLSAGIGVFAPATLLAVIDLLTLSHGIDDFKSGKSTDWQARKEITSGLGLSFNSGQQEADLCYLSLGAMRFVGCIALACLLSSQNDTGYKLFVAGLGIAGAAIIDGIVATGIVDIGKGILAERWEK